MAIFHFSRNEIQPLSPTSFDGLKLFERSDLQRLLRDRLEVVAPDAMLIAEEFGDWSDGRRRIDLLAIDRNANLVVIELKRTEDAGHVELQALRYAAMVSTMTFDQAVDAHSAYLLRNGREGDSRSAILEFLGWDESIEGDFAGDVRIVLVASDFQREITTTVLWLNERDLDIRCVRMRPYLFNGEVLVDVQQVIPLPEAVDYQVRVRERNEQRRVTATLAGERDRTKFDVSIDGLIYRGLNKRRAILTVVRALATAGVAPDAMSRAVPERGDRFLIGADGELDALEFVAAMRATRTAQGRAFDERRWFSADDELIHFSGRTYAVSNQWGIGTDSAISALIAKFPDAGISAQSSSVA